MRSDSRFLAGVAAVAAAIAAVIQLSEGDWLRGATGLAIVGALVVLATGQTDQSRWVKWLGYGFLTLAFVLLGIRLISRWTRAT